MPKRLQPRAEYREHDGYPASCGDGVSRRGFLKGALVSGAAVAGAVTGARVARAGKDKRLQVTIYISNYHSIPGTDLRAQKLVVFTGNKALAKWLGSYANSQAVAKELMVPIRKVKSDAIYDGKKLYRLERALAGVVAKQYLRATRKRVAAPDVMLELARNYRYHGCPGAPRRPTLPVP